MKIGGLYMTCVSLWVGNTNDICDIYIPPGEIVLYLKDTKETNINLDYITVLWKDKICLLRYSTHSDIASRWFKKYPEM